MANITPGELFSDPSLTPTKLNNIMDAATLANLGVSELASGIGFFLLTMPASPVEGDIVVTDSTGRFQSYDGSAWNLDRADPLTISLTNMSGTGMTAGDVVYGDPANDDSFIMADGTVQAMNVVGVLAANIADSAAGNVYIKGVCSVKITAGTGGGSPGDWLTPFSAAGSTHAVPTNPSSPSAGGAEFFGMLLDTVPASTTTLASCLLWR